MFRQTWTRILETFTAMFVMPSNFDFAYSLLQGPQQLPISWSHIFHIAITIVVSDTSNLPQHDTVIVASRAL